MGVYYTLVASGNTYSLNSKWNTTLISGTVSDVELEDKLLINEYGEEYYGSVQKNGLDGIAIENENLSSIRDGIEVKFNEVSFEYTEKYSEIIDELTLTLPLSEALNLDVNDVVKLYIDGSIIFNGDVATKKDEQQGTVTCYSRLAELKDIYIRELYTNMSIEAIIKQMIEDYTDMTVEYEEDTIVISKYPALGFIMDSITLLLQIGGYYIRLVGDTVQIRSNTKYISGTIYDSSLNVKNAVKSKEDVVNSLYFKGKGTSINTTESHTIVDGEIELDHIMDSNLKITQSGVEVSSSEYSLDTINKVITFTGVSGTVDVSYTYIKPLLVHIEDDDSQRNFGLKCSTMDKDWINDEILAMDISGTYLDDYSSKMVNLTASSIKKLWRSGNLYKIVSKKYGINQAMQCNSYKLKNTDVEVEFGRYEKDITDKYFDYEQRLIDMEKKYYEYEGYTKVKHGSEQVFVNMEDILTQSATLSGAIETITAKVNDSIMMEIGQEINSAYIGIFVMGLHDIGD